ncbi:hypothetical protein D9757_010937 [Collybiopsis confluens]|uniref:Uncharacterized protein n=1 Tax=Collybiopsis confluens TaxID=2823264 RepID=A0A8H5GJX0_9AGAR|nr:hypothetical protein D9757_010937 [Collybiopsis confluens]
MTDTSQAILFVYGECGKFVEEDRYNDWYDNEHAPLRLTVPGFLSASRYKALDTPPKLGPKWLAIYDMTSKAIMQSQPYLELRFRASENERQVVANLEMLNRRVYTLVHASGVGASQGGVEGNNAARFSYVVHMRVLNPEDKKKAQNEKNRAGQEARFIDWYTSTRIPLLAVVPKYIRSRVFALAEHVELAGRAATSSTPVYNFLAIHEWDAEGSEVTASSEFKMSMTAAEPWQVEGGEAGVVEMEDRMFGLYKDFLDGLRVGGL